MKHVATVSFIVLFPLALFAYTSPGKPTGFVNDFAHILSPGTVSSLNTELTNFSNQTTSEITVATVSSIGNETIETYAVKLFQEWGIGKVKQDNGVLLLIVPSEHAVRIEVGYGLEPVITDIESAHIISDVITPVFQAGDYDKGVSTAVARLETDAAKGYPVQSNTSTTPRVPVGFSFLSHYLYQIIFGFIFLGSFLGRSKSWWAGGVIGAIVGLMIGMFSGLVAGIVAFVILVPLGLLFDYIVSKHGGSGRGPFPPFFWGGGGFGGGSGSGGGFSGFGGGGSGGGGASGNW